MSKAKLEYDKEYNDGNITLGEVTKLREDYNKSSAYDKGNLDIKYRKKEVDSKQKKSEQQSPSKKSSISNIFDYTEERDVFWLKRYPTSRILYRILEILNILALIILAIGIIYILTSVYFGVFQTLFVFAIAMGFSIVSFLLFRETILFQVDKNFLLYKQSEKYLK